MRKNDSTSELGAITRNPSILEPKSSASSAMVNVRRLDPEKTITNAPLETAVFVHPDIQPTTGTGQSNTARAKEFPVTVQTEELDAADSVIAIIGPTGAGKSMFINSTIGRDVQPVGHSLDPCTSEILPFRFWVQENKQFVVLVDTPGFSSTDKSDFDILKIVSDWLKSRYGNEKRLFGILYLHRILDNRMTFVPIRCSKAFRKLCGDDYPAKVHLVTTMWDEVDPEIGKMRMDELATDNWKEMVDRGALTIRHDNDFPRETIRKVLAVGESTVNQPLAQERLAPPIITGTDQGREMDLVFNMQPPPLIGQQRPHMAQQLEGAKIAKTEDLATDDIVIGTVGPTGAGKSTFIRSASGTETQEVGHSLKPCTKDIFAIRYWDQESRRHVVLLDTPGFNDMDVHRSDSDVLKMISGWLAKSYGAKMPLSAIFYFHRITDNRTAGAPLMNIPLIRKLCGKDSLETVYLITTMWDEVEPEVGEGRLHELGAQYWKEMTNRGSPIVRCRIDNAPQGSPNSVISNVNFPGVDVASLKGPEGIYPKALIRQILDLEMVRKGNQVVANNTGARLTSKVPAPVHDRPSTSWSARAPSQCRTEAKEPPMSRKIEDLDPDDIVIAIMGPTGSGKSSFISAVVGRGTTGIGQPLNSFTSRVFTLRFWDEESRRHVVLVDMPSFNDTYRSDYDVLKMISEWLNESYRDGKRLSAILYFHRITDGMTGVLLSNLRLFREMCGEDALKVVYLTTTMWDEVDLEVGMMRLDELKKYYWKEMVDRGAHIICCGIDDNASQDDFPNSSVSGSVTRKGHSGSPMVHPPKVLIRQILDQDMVRMAVQLQREMGDMKKELKETSAGQQLFSELEGLVEKQTRLLRRIAKERREATDPKLVEELRKEYDELRTQMDDRTRQMQELRLPQPSRWISKISKPGWKAIRRHRKS